MILHLICICCLALLILKCIVLLIFWFLRRFRNIQISCQTCYGVWYKNFVFSPNSGLRFSINNVWLSSSYVNCNFNKPLVICLGGFNVKVMSKFRKSSPVRSSHVSGSSSTFRSGYLGSYLHLVEKFTSVCIRDTSVKYIDSTDAIVFTSTQLMLEMETEMSKNMPTFRLLAQGFSISNIPHQKSKVLEVTSDSTLDVSATLRIPGVNNWTAFSIQSLVIDCSQLKANIDGDVLGLQSSNTRKEIRHSVYSDAFDDIVLEHSSTSPIINNAINNNNTNNSSNNTQQTTMVKFIPELLQVNNKDVELTISFASQKKDFTTSWKELFINANVLSGNHQDPQPREVKVEVTGLKMQSGEREMLLVEQIGSHMLLLKEEISMTLNCRGGHVTYLHEDIMSLTHLVRRITEPRPPVLSNTSNSNSLLTTFTSGVLQTKLYANIYSFTFTIPSQRSKFILGLPGTRVSILGTIQDRVVSDYIVEVEMTSTYVRLMEQDNNNNINNNNLNNNNNNNFNNNKMEELSAKRHFWGTPVYFGLLFLKVTRYGNHISLECMVDNLRLESSDPILSAVQSLDDILRDDLMDLYHWLKSLKKKPAPKADWSTKQVKKSVQLFLQMSCLNVFVCHKNNASVMLRCDSASIPLCSPSDVSLILYGVKSTHFIRSGKFHVVTKSSDITNEILYIPMASINFNIPLKNVVVEAAENLVAVWSYSVHLCLYETFRRLSQIFRRESSSSSSERDKEERGSDAIEVMLFFSCSILVNLSANHSMKLDMKNFQLEKTSTDGIIIKTSRLHVSSDQHTLLKIEALKLKSDPRGEKLTSERSLTCPELLLTSNRAWLFTAEVFDLAFPYDFNFALWFDEVKRLRKWLRMNHSRSEQVPSIASDVFISVDCITIHICEDPFEVKLGDNYELLCDESLENEKRISALNKRVEELKMKNTFISEKKLESLYEALSEKMSQVYIQRANQMYSQSPMRTSLCMWVIQSFELVLFADPCMTYKHDVMNFMAQVNSESLLPEDLDFQSFFLRRIRCSTSSIMLQLKDFPQPMLQINDWLISGRLCGAETNGERRGQTSNTIDLGHPWGKTNITKNLPPVKLYYDINSELKNFLMTYGSCWEPIVSQISLSMNKILRSSLDPSPLLPFWDKWRYLLHGNLVITMDRSSWMCHASLDPYNTTEFMDWTWSDLVFKWVTGEVIYEGDLEILLRTASKYDECCFLKWNSLQLLFKLDWQCKGDPYNHHSIVPCSPEYVSTLENPKEHDTYRDFRSASLMFGCSMKSLSHPMTSPLNFSSLSPGDVFSPGPSSSPKCLFYSSTIRWLDRLKVCLARISRPIRKGRYFKTPVRVKPKFTRHISCLNFNLALPSLNCSYWSSFRRSFGVEFNSGPMRLDASVAVETRQTIEGSQGALMTRRLQRVIGMMKLHAGFESLAVWLSSQIHQRKTKFKPFDSERSFLLSVDKVNYQRIEEQPIDDKVSDDPLHQVEVHDLKACWTSYNRDIVFALHDSYAKSQMLQRNLSADALKGVKVEPTCHTPKKPARPLGQQFGFSHPSNQQPPHADVLLQKLIRESESKFVAVHEEISGAGVDMEHLHGYQVCQTDDVVRKNWNVTLVNSQVMLSGCETSGCIIVSTPRATLLSCLRHPIITSNHQLRSKTTLVGSIESMQYYATITDDIRPENIRWLTTRDIEERPSMTSNDPSTSLTLENIIHDTDDVETDVSHIQRIISRCRCQFYWSWYGELEDDMLDVPLQIDEYSDVMKIQEGIDAFTLIHHDLDISTNSVQYATALDIVNNLLLHVEPKKKEQLEKLMNMRFKIQLSSDQDHKSPIFLKQNQLRRFMDKVKALEKEVYMSQRACTDGETKELLRDLEETKEHINFLSEELALMLSCYRESLLQTSSSSSSSSSSSQKQSSVKREVMMTKKIDLFLQHVEWRLNESDGQIGISHIVLSNFLYTRMMHENDCGSHQLELGWCHVTNLLPEDQLYKDVLAPQETLGRTSLSNRRCILRVLCKFRSPVGGISIKEHLEVNVVPLTIQMTARFYSAVMMFFFPGKPVESDDEGVSDLEESQSTSSLTLVPSKKKFASLRKKSNTMSSVNDIDKMKERAAKNNMFIYIKISDVSLKVSYKSEKDKHIMNIRDFQFLSPMLEYHNQTWSWHDLTMTLKRECKKVIIAQAVRQKLHIKSKSLFAEVMTFQRGITGSEEDTDKTKMLLGLSIPETKQKKNKKKSLFFK